jgi:hypothetical protein
MDATVAIGTERDQILFDVVTQLASRAHVVDLKTIRATAVLASPAIPLQHIATKFAIGIRVEPKSRLSLPNRFHAVFSTCRRNSTF